MRFDLHQLVEGPDELEVGPYVGALWIAPDALEVEVADDDLRDRLTRLLLEPLRVRWAGAGTQGTRVTELFCDEEGYPQALRERLEQRDFRLLVEET